MPHISTDTRILFWVIAAIAGALFAILGDELGKNIIYFISRRGRPPNSRPAHIWTIFFICMFFSIVFGALAAFAPVATDLPVESPETSTTPTNPATSIRLMPIDGQNILVELMGRPLSQGETIPLNESITVRFIILNNGTVPATVKALVIGARGPGVGCGNKNAEKWSAPDNPFTASENITIQPGEKYEYQGSRAFFLPGRYFLEP